MLRPPPVPPLPPAPRAFPLPPPKAANPNTDPTTTAAAGTAMGVAAWWRRALGQRFNPAGVAVVVGVAESEPRLALPHVRCRTSGGWTGASSAEPGSAASCSIRAAARRRVRPVPRGLPAWLPRRLQQLRRVEGV